MRKSIKENIRNCRESNDEMNSSDFKDCVNAVYFHLGQAMKYEDGSRMSNNHLRIADNICAATSDCFLDEEDNLVNWFKGEECAFCHPVTRQTIKIRIRDDCDAIYFFLRYCMKLKRKEKIEDDFLSYLSYILCESCLS